jgi:hypothetical protein
LESIPGTLNTQYARKPEKLQQEYMLIEWEMDQKLQTMDLSLEEEVIYN